jgi:hypothetical protein
MGERYGPNWNTQTIVPCALPYCLTCRDNYQICTECDTANGYILVNDMYCKDFATPVRVDLSTTPPQHPSADITFLANFNSVPRVADSDLANTLEVKISGDGRYGTVDMVKETDFKLVVALVDASRVNRTLAVSVVFLKVPSARKGKASISVKDSAARISLANQWYAFERSSLENETNKL